MEFCTSSSSSCFIATTLVAAQPFAIAFAALRTSSTPSKIQALKSTRLFEQDQSLIERNPLIKHAKQALAIAVSIFSLVISLRVIIGTELFSLPLALSFFLQFGVNFTLIFLHRYEHIHQGASGLPVQLLQTFSVASSILTTWILDFWSIASIDEQVITILLVIAQCMSVILITSYQSEFSSYAKILQNQLGTNDMKQFNNSSNNKTPLLNSSNETNFYQQNQAISFSNEEDPDIYVKQKSIKNDKDEQAPSKESKSRRNSTINTTVGQSSSNRGSRSNSIMSLQTRCSDENEGVSPQSSLQSSILGCDESLEEDDMILTEEMRAEAREEALRSRAATNERIGRLQEQQPIKSCVDLKVIGYKVREQRMMFIVSHLPSNAQNSQYVLVERTHKEFKQLSKVLSNEVLNNSELSLPLLPKPIKKDAPLDKDIITEKIVKYNRFLFYIEYNSIQSDNLRAFLNQTN